MIPEYADDLDFENRLPPGQVPIMTTSVKRFHAYMQFIMQSREETGYATMPTNCATSSLTSSEQG